MAATSRKLVGMAAGAFGISWLVRAAWGIPSAMGASIAAIAPTARGARTYRNKQFHNTEPSSQITGSMAEVLYQLATQRNHGRPPGAIPLVTPEL